MHSMSNQSSESCVTQAELAQAEAALGRYRMPRHEVAALEVTNLYILSMHLMDAEQKARLVRLYRECVVRGIDAPNLLSELRREGN